MNRRDALKCIAALPVVAPAVVASLPTAELPAVCLPAPFWGNSLITVRAMTLTELEKCYLQVQKNYDFAMRYSWRATVGGLGDRGPAGEVGNDRP